MAVPTTVQAEAEETPWIQRFHEPAAARLLCLPHAGGSASYFFPLSRALCPDVEVLAVQYPGRQNRRHEPFATDVAQLVRSVQDALADRADGSLALFGHSMGAVIAFELARALQRSGAPAPLHLFVSGRRAPSCHRDGVMHALPDPALIEEVKGNGGTSQTILDDPELLTLFLPVIRNDYRVTETYRYQPGPPLHCPVTVLTGDRDPAVTLGEAAAWQRHTTGPFDLRVFPGSHFYLEDHQAEITDLLRIEPVEGRGRDQGGR